MIIIVSIHTCIRINVNQVGIKSKRIDMVIGVCISYWSSLNIKIRCAISITTPISNGINPIEKPNRFPKNMKIDLKMVIKRALTHTHLMAAAPYIVSNWNEQLRITHYVDCQHTAFRFWSRLNAKPFICMVLIFVLGYGDVWDVVRRRELR